MRPALARTEDAVLADLARGTTIGADGLRFLLRRYETAPRAGLDETIGRALACALDADLQRFSPSEQAGYLELFVDALSFSADERLIHAAAALAPSLCAQWRSKRIDEAYLAIDACLYASALARYRQVVADAVDELERLVARTYEPGEPFGTHADQVCAASALLTAFDVSGRLPYSMLAEELIQPVRRDAAVSFESACRAARVLCRLARLHDDADYQSAAVVAPSADYRTDAERLLRMHEDEALRRGSGAAIYGLALLELESGPPV